MSYVDGFVITMPKKNLDTYQKIATDAGKLWMKHGALSYYECVGDDLQPEHVTLTFPLLTKCADDEIVIFSFITYKDKAHRDEVNAKVMADPGMQEAPTEMPFEMNKMAFGGFEAIVQY